MRGSAHPIAHHTATHRTATAAAAARRRCAAAVTAALPMGGGDAQASDKVKVVASFSILGEMASEVGGDHVEVASLVGPNGDVHVYEPTPGDVRILAGAATFFFSSMASVSRAG